METMEFLKLAVVVILGYFILKFIWGTAKGIVKLILAVIIIAIGVYVMKPELLYDVFGKDKVEGVAKDVEKNGKELIEEGEKLFKDSIESKVDLDSVEKELKKAVETVTK